MNKYKLTETEEKFSHLIWDNEPIASGELVKLCEMEMDWKKSTTYTVLKKLCDKRIFRNENAVIYSIITKSDYYANQSINFVEENFSGSLPRFLTAFMRKKKLDKKQVEDLKRLINEYEEK